MSDQNNKNQQQPQKFESQYLDPATVAMIQDFAKMFASYLHQCQAQQLSTLPQIDFPVDNETKLPANDKNNGTQKLVDIAKIKRTIKYNRARDVLAELVQTRSISEYVDSFMDAIMAVDGIQDEECTDRFMRGLKDPNLIFKIRCIPYELRTLDKVINLALEYEYAHNIPGSNAPSGNDNRAGPNGYQGNNNAHLKSKPKGKKYRKSANSRIVCDFCGKRGHPQSKCFKLTDTNVAGLDRFENSKGKGRESR